MKYKIILLFLLFLSNWASSQTALSNKKLAIKKGSIYCSTENKQFERPLYGSENFEKGKKPILSDRYIYMLEIRGCRYKIHHASCCDRNCAQARSIHLPGSCSINQVITYIDGIAVKGTHPIEQQPSLFYSMFYSGLSAKYEN